MSAPSATVPVALRTGSRDGGLTPVYVSRRQAADQGSAASHPFAGGELFAGCVAHELRTPLAAQRALLELALANPNTNAADWREIGEDILLACRRQERLLEACLTLVRSGVGPQRCEPIDLAVLTAESLRAHNLDGLDSVVALARARTNGDPELLHVVVANLVSNAIRHNVVGGRIEVTTRAESGRAVISVANTGLPIPAAEVQRLFQPFQRLSSSPRSLSDGLGLGLAIVQAIADAHAAIVTMRPRAGGGLEIEVSFPTRERT